MTKPKISQFSMLKTALRIANTCLSAKRQARGLGLTIREWEETVEATRDLIVADLTPDEIRVLAQARVGRLGDAQLDPAAAELHDIQSRGSSAGYTRFEDLTDDERNDYRTEAEYAIRGFMSRLVINPGGDHE